MPEGYEQIPIEEREIVCPKHGKVFVQCISLFGVKHFGECPICSAEKEAKEQEALDRKRKFLEKERWKQSNVKEKFWKMTFADYKPQNESQEKALSLSKGIADGTNKKSLVLIGPYGTGKTMLASLAVMARGGYIYKMYEVAMMVKSSYKPNAEEDEWDILKRLAACPVLAIDEIGRQFGSESERNWLSYVIDERYEQYDGDGVPLPMILLSNLKLMRDCSEDEKSRGLYLERYLGADSVSRLCECADIVSLEGKDWRRG